MRLFRLVALTAPAILTVAASAHAQGRAPARPSRPAASPPPAALPAEPAPTAAAPPAATSAVPIPNDLLKVTPGGLTSQQVGDRAAATSYTAKAAAETMRAAAARVDIAWSAFLPRLTGTAKYQRLSDFLPPDLGGGFRIPNILDNYLLQANIVVPLSDYFLKINQTYSATTASREATRCDMVAARAKSSADGRVAFYAWLRARGAVVVAALALEDQHTHLKDANNLFNVGNASRADVLRAETAVAAADLTLERARNLADLTEVQVRVAIHADESEVLRPGEGLDSVTPEEPGNLRELVTEGTANRYEVKSADANAEAARRQAAAARSAAFPSLSGFADAIYANPNPRRFSDTAEWFPSWDVGAQLAWSPNDMLVGGAGAGDYNARAAAIEAQRGVVRDGIAVEVTQAWQQVKEGVVALESTKRELASATEAYRVAHELFVNGRGTSTTLTDAETELTRARLDALNASADARIARVRLDHAVGRDTRAAKGAE